MPTLQQLLQHPASGGSFDPGRLEQIERALVEDHKSDMPWYLRFIVGVGAWLASIFFIGFFVVLIGSQENHRMTYGVSGLVLLVVSTILFRQKFGLFVNQCCLAASLAGQFMIYYGLLPEQHHTLSSAAILSIGLAAALYGLYPDMLQRLITCVAALQITLAWIYLGNNGDLLTPEVDPGHAVNFLASSYWVLHLAALAGCLIFVGRWSVNLAPLGYAMVISLAAWQLENLFGVWVTNEIIPVLPSNHEAAHLAVATWSNYIRPICTALMLLGVITWAAGCAGALQRFPLPFICLGCALIAIIWLGAGGVLLALLLITLGLVLESRVIQGAGLILLPIFLFNYYYNLDLNLLAKSVALIGSGLVLLLLRTGLRRWLPVDAKEVG